MRARLGLLLRIMSWGIRGGKLDRDSSWLWFVLIYGLWVVAISNRSLWLDEANSAGAANLLAADANSADLVLKIYLFQFGLAQGSQLDFFGKVEFTTIVKNLKSGESQEVKAAGTSIAKVAVLKKNIQKNVQDDVEASLRDAVRNFLRGQQLKDAVGALRKSTDLAPAAAPNP